MKLNQKTLTTFGRQTCSHENNQYFTFLIFISSQGCVGFPKKIIDSNFCQCAIRNKVNTP